MHLNDDDDKTHPASTALRTFLLAYRRLPPVANPFVGTFRELRHPVEHVMETRGEVRFGEKEGGGGKSKIRDEEEGRRRIQKSQ